MSTFTVQCSWPAAPFCIHLRKCPVSPSNDSQPLPGPPSLPCPWHTLSPWQSPFSVLFLNLSTLSAWYTWILSACVCVCVLCARTRVHVAECRESLYHVWVSFVRTNSTLVCVVCMLYVSVCILLPTHPAVGTSVVPTLELLTMLWTCIYKYPSDPA